MGGYPNMVCEISTLKAQLLNRLQQKGVDPHLIPGLLRLLANSLFVHRHTNRTKVSAHLKFLGWEDFELDEHTYHLVTACFENEDLKSLKSMPATWFDARFAPQAC